MDGDAAFFERDGAGFVASEHGRGPWSPDHLHGGPPTALLVRGARELLGAGVAVVRVTVELLRPVPIGRLRLVAAPLPSGTTAPRVGVSLLAGEKECARAVVMGLREVELPEAERGGTGERLAPPSEAAAFDFGFFRWEVGYHTSVEARLLSGELGRTPVKMWMRPRVALVAGEVTGLVEGALICADSGSGVSQILDTRRFTFVNADLSVYFERVPEGEWTCLDARTTVGRCGVGLAESRLWDERGLFGRGAQALVVRPVG